MYKTAFLDASLTCSTCVNINKLIHLHGFVTALPQPRTFCHGWFSTASPRQFCLGLSFRLVKTASPAFLLIAHCEVMNKKLLYKSKLCLPESELCWMKCFTAGCCWWRQPHNTHFYSIKEICLLGNLNSLWFILVTLQGLKRNDQNTMADVYRVRRPATQSGGPAGSKPDGKPGSTATPTSPTNESIEHESSRIRKLEKLIKKRL